MRKRTPLLVFLCLAGITLLLLASPAQAQASTTMTCGLHHHSGCGDVNGDGRRIYLNLLYSAEHYPLTV
jgi:hypothetical protein